jgi:ABC transporter substrate binding protein
MREERMSDLPPLADELIRLNVDVILAVNTAAALAAKKATTTIPIVITRVADPVKSGLVASISRPGGNITGLSFLPEALSAKQLQLLEEALPGVSRVAALWYAGNPGSAITLKGMEVVSAQLDLQLQGYDLYLVRYGGEGWRCIFYTTGKEHSLTSTTGSAWEKTPWLAVQRAAARALHKIERPE